jgi:putative transposase
MKYEFMEEHRETYKVKSICKVLKVSRSGYYAWSTRHPSRGKQANEELLERIRKIHCQNRRLYGSPRITAALHEEGIRCGKKRVARIMKDHSIRADVKKRRFRRTTMKLNHVSTFSGGGQFETVILSVIIFPSIFNIKELTPRTILFGVKM